MKVPMAGITDFESFIVKDAYYVDKTMFLASFISDLPRQEGIVKKDSEIELGAERDMTSYVSLFTRPRRFGKSLTLDMVESFFSNTKISSPSRLFQDLDIGNFPSCMEHCGRYPVIRINLKDISCCNRSDLVSGIAGVVKNLYYEFSSILNQDRIPDAYRKIFQYYVSANENEYSVEDMKNSVFRLTKILNLYYDTKVIVLIDEYDSPVSNIQDFSKTKEIVSALKDFFGRTLKDNTSVKFSMITGINQISKNSIYSGLNHVSVYDLNDTKFNDVFGFTDTEVLNLLKEAGCSDMYEKIRNWYDGYIIGGEHIYNPWSVMKFIENKYILKPYWKETSSNHIYQLYINTINSNTIENMKKLYDGNGIEMVLRDDITMENIANDVSTLYTVLFHSGYLTGRCIKDNEYNLYIPNKEVCKGFLEEIVNRFFPSFLSSHRNEFLKSMMSSDEVFFEKKINKLLSCYTSFHDLTSDPRENSYHCFVLGLIACAAEDYYVYSNRESGKGRFDISIYSKNSIEKQGCILEFKYSDCEENMKIMAAEAFSQIEEKEYDSDLKMHGISDIKKIGIAFFGKSAKVCCTDRTMQEWIKLKRVNSKKDHRSRRRMSVEEAIDIVNDGVNLMGMNIREAVALLPNTEYTKRNILCDKNFREHLKILKDDLKR